MTTDKTEIKTIADICALKDIDTAVISPGSRNAPLILAFNQHPDINCLSIPDERSAGFFALGIAQQTDKTVALICTSGSAVLNYAPAISEAYYQKIPLLILTADRPEELTDQGDGQTIRQVGIYKNYIKKSFQYPLNLTGKQDIRYCQRIVNDAINLTRYPDCGPVHINIPLSEPLFDKVKNQTNIKYKIIDIIPPKLNLPDIYINQLLSEWNSFSKKMIFTGTMNFHPGLNKVLKKITKNKSAVVVTENTSNIYSDTFIYGIDRLISGMSADEQKDFKPDLLITIGGNIISKKIKALIRDNKPEEHWHISPGDFHPDTYYSLTKNICVEPEYFFEKIIEGDKTINFDYFEKCLQRKDFAKEKHLEFLNKAPYCDLKVFETILNRIPQNCNLHLANSTPIRYTQLFPTVEKIKYNSNRGTSGIDGCVSTAAGASFANNKHTVIITGDIAFFYDSNALWNNYISPFLRIIIINNSGGGIFRIIDGPDKTEELEQFFETKQNHKAEHIAKTFNFTYHFSDNIEKLHKILPEFFDMPGDKAAILEIKTPRELNAKVLKDYFKYIKK